MQPKSNISPNLKSLSPAIHGLLSRLRARIRWFVLLEGIAMAIACFLLMFWVALAIDYVPIRYGLSELSQTARIVILVLIASMIGWVFYRLALRRVLVRLKNESLAILVERRYTQFGDSLLTTISQARTQHVDHAVDSAMLARTRLDAESHLANVDLAEVVHSGPLKRSLVFAGILLASLLCLAIANPNMLKIATQRLVFLQENTWPRRSQIELVGIKVERKQPVEGIEELGKYISPKNGEFRIAKGSTVTISIRAANNQENSDIRLPNNCSLIYQIKGGDRGVQLFKRIRAPRDGYQMYSLDGQPLRGILDDITFDILGGDHRLGPFTLSVVDEPFVYETKLALEYPPYMVDPSADRWQPRTIDWSGQSRIPEGTRVTILAKSKKELTKVYALDRFRQTMNLIPVSGSEFSFEIPSLMEAESLQFFLCDTDGLIAENPHTVNIDSIEDLPPVVQTRLVGIGTAVTPDVQIPIAGSATDDYGLKRTWMEIEIGDSPAVTEMVDVEPNSTLDFIFDFKQKRQEQGPLFELPPGDESQVHLVVKSEDNFDLRESTNVGIGDRYSLDVVTPNELLMILERLEVGQRQRLEQIYLELSDARNYLVRAKSERASIDDGLIEPGDRNDAEEAEDDDDSVDGPNAIQKQELRLLFAQRAILQVDKSRQEILGSAEAFDNIRMQLINNRIDSEDKKNRISDQIIAPLRLIGDDSMRQLKDDVLVLESSLRDLQTSPLDESVSGNANQLAMVSIEKIDVVLQQLDSVLGILVKYETQNELLEIVRQMIKKQKALMDRTKKERQRKAFEGLLD